MEMKNQGPKLYLISSSPRRAELLRRYGYKFEVIEPKAVEKEYPKPRVLALANAIQKFMSVKFDGVGLAADTLVVVDNQNLGKPKDMDEARKFLRLLSGREHSVITAIVVGTSKKFSYEIVTTIVKFMELGEFELDYILRADNPLDKAGGYAIQGAAGMFVEYIKGSYTNVIGLPMPDVYIQLSRYGIRPEIPRFM